jgi:hypothetical protein
MRKNRLKALLVGMLLSVAASPAIAQHTVVNKNGVGGRIETDYNAADKAIEMRTIGPDGKVQQRVNYENLPGYYVPQQTDTTYWPNGQLRKVSRHTYDENANFTGEFIQTFDEAGKQIAGHKLTHDPWKGTYRCAEWNVATQDYRAVACPSGEEEGGGGGAEEPKKFSYDEVMKYLEAARNNAAREKEKPGGATGAGTGDMSHSDAKREAGIILPAQFRRGERISGIVVENPDAYDGLPELRVTRIRVPFESGGEGSRLQGWTFEAPGEEPRRADGTVTLVVPKSGPLTVTIRQADVPAHFVSQKLDFERAAGANKGTASSHSFEAAALCMKGSLCTVSGPFGGDSRRTFVAFEDRPAVIVAESTSTAYISVPALTEAGPRPLIIEESPGAGSADGSAEGSKVIALPVVVGRLSIRNNGREVQSGETVITFPTLEGLSGLPDGAWQTDKFPAEDFERARRLIPGFKLDNEKCEAQEQEEAKDEREGEETKTAGEKGRDEGREEKREKKDEKEEGGRILLVLKNLAPERTSLHGSRNETVVFCLSDEAFQRGDFKYDLRIDARKSEKIDVMGYVIPFLAPVAGQELRIKTAP